MLTNKVRFIVDILTEGMVEDANTQVIAQRIATALMNWAMNSESGLVASLPMNDDEAYTLAVMVYDPQSGQKLAGETC